MWKLTLGEDSLTGRAPRSSRPKGSRKCPRLDQNNPGIAWSRDPGLVMRAQTGMRIQVQAEVGIRTCPIAETEAQLERGT